jgi:hypothetical protein
MTGACWWYGAFLNGVAGQTLFGFCHMLLSFFVLRTPGHACTLQHFVPRTLLCSTYLGLPYQTMQGLRQLPARQTLDNFLKIQLRVCRRAIVGVPAWSHSGVRLWGSGVCGSTRFGKGEGAWGNGCVVAPRPHRSSKNTKLKATWRSHRHTQASMSTFRSNC